MRTTTTLAACAVVCLMAISGTARAHDDMHGKHMRHHMMGCHGALSPDKEKMMHESMHKVMEANKPMFGDMRKLHEALHAIMTADKFDRSAFLARTDEMAALHMKMEKSHTEAMADAAEKLTADERRAMSKCMMAMGGPMMMHGGMMHGGMMHPGMMRPGMRHHGWGATESHDGAPEDRPHGEGARTWQYQEEEPAAPAATHGDWSTLNN